MAEQFNIADVYDKNLNFLIGSGASYGLFPTLQLSIKDEDGLSQTIETLASKFIEQNKTKQLALLFIHYYKECIEPVLLFDIKKAQENSEKKVVTVNYETFLKNILLVLQRRKNTKTCNVFTTNYDGCVTHVADDIIKSGSDEFVLNDGARGFSRRYLHVKNYNSFLNQAGVFDRFSTAIPQINLIPMHGSVYWQKDSDSILVDYSEKSTSRTIDSGSVPDIAAFTSCLNDDSKKISDLPEIEITDTQIKTFWAFYNALPIVNPTKWKFHETVFDEHYYQILRHLSYELEKPNSVLITFGFSFADEHIFNIIKRSLSNPSLQLFISCYNENEYTVLHKKFEKFKNVTFLRSDSNLDFSYFNEKLFTTTKPTPADSRVSNDS